MRSRYPLFLCLVVLVAALASLQGAHGDEAVCIKPPIDRVDPICIGDPGGQPICLPGPVTPAPICVDIPPDGDGPGPDPCGEGETPDPGQGHEGGQPMCLPGPASCVAVDVAVKVNDPTSLTGGVDFQLSRSTAQAFSFPGPNGSATGQSNSDAAQHKLNVPPALGEGVIESECHAVSTAFADPQGQILQQNHAEGQADVTHFSVDLNPSLPLAIAGDVLCEQGASENTVGAIPSPLPPPPPPFLFFISPDGCTANPAPPPPAVVDPGASVTGGNRADIANLLINGVQVIPTGLTSAPPNTAIPIPPPYPGVIADLYLNEQGTSSVGFCPLSVPPFFTPATTYWGDALRIVVKNPITSATLATVTISHVATTTCPSPTP